MTRVLLPSSAFLRQLKRLKKRQPDLAEPIQKVLDQLSEDPRIPALKTHKLGGNLQGSWSCSVAYDLRIVFRFTEYEGQEAISLQSLGKHDQVY